MVADRQAPSPMAAFSTQGLDHVACHSVYFEDPDGHRIELTTYEV